MNRARETCQERFRRLARLARTVDDLPDVLDAAKTYMLLEGPWVQPEVCRELERLDVLFLAHAEVQRLLALQDEASNGPLSDLCEWLGNWLLDKLDSWAETLFERVRRRWAGSILWLERRGWLVRATREDAP
jgi:hypothetical protein